MEDNKTSTKKKTMGRRKIEMKRIEKKSSRQVTFTKRRMGLFRKASEMSILCGSEMVILVQSPASKVFAFGNESLLDRFHCQSPRRSIMTSSLSELDSTLITSRNKYDDAVRKLEDEKKRCLIESGSEMKTGFWWDAPIENMELRELEEFVEALEGLRGNVLCGVDDSSSSKSLNLLLANLESNYNNNHDDGAAEFNYTDLLELDYFDNNGGEQQHSSVGGKSSTLDDGMVQNPTQGINSAYSSAGSSASASASALEICNNNNSTTSTDNLNYPELDDPSFFEELNEYMKTNPIPELDSYLVTRHLII